MRNEWLDDMDDPNDNVSQYETGKGKKRIGKLVIFAVVVIIVVAGMFIYINQSDNAVLTGRYIIANRNETNMTYRSDIISAHNFEVTALPVYLDVNPQWENMVELGFENRKGGIDYVWGMYRIWGNHLFISPASDGREYVDPTKKVIYKLEKHLEYSFSFNGMALNIESGDLTVILENQHYAETGEIILSGRASSARIYNDVQGMYLKYIGSHNRPKGFLYLSDGVVAKTEVSVKIESGEVSFNWDAVYRKSNEDDPFGLFRSEEAGKLKMDILNCYPYGFIIRENGKIYKYFNESDRSGKYVCTQEDIEKDKYVLDFVPLEEMLDDAQKECAQKVIDFYIQEAGDRKAEGESVIIKLSGDINIEGAVEDERIWLQAEGLTLRSYDGGKKWEAAESTFQVGYFTHYVFIYDQTVVIQSYEESSPTLLISNDGGEHFQKIMFSNIWFTPLERLEYGEGGYWGNVYFAPERIVSDWCCAGEEDRFRIEYAMDSHEYTLTEKTVQP